jgi:hypothetical protein
MTTLTVLTLVLVAAVVYVGRDVITALRRIEELLTAKQVESPLPFPAQALVGQQVEIHKAQEKAQELADAWQERWGGKKLQNADEEAECMRAERESTYEYRMAECEERLFCEMVRANARVGLGEELFYDARSRVSHENHDRRIAEMMRSAEARRAGRFLSEMVQRDEKTDEGQPT